jgi:MFS family permease
MHTIGSAVLFGALVLPFEGFLARKQFHASDEQLLLLAMAPFGGFLLTTLTGRLAGHFRQSRIAGMVSVLARLPFVFLAVVTGAAPFTAVMCFGRMFSAVSFASFNSLLKIYVPGKARSSLLTWFRILPIVIAIPLSKAAGHYLDHNPEGYRLIFPVAAAGALALALGFFFLPRRAREQRILERPVGLFEEFKLIKRDRRFACFVGVFFIGTLGEKIGMPVMPIYLADELQLTYRQVAQALGVVGPLLAIVGYVVWGAALKKLTPITILTLCMFGKGIRPILWALAAGTEDPMLLLVPGQAIFRFCISGMELGAILTVLKMSNNRELPIYMGLHFGLMGVRGLGGPVIGWFLLKTQVPLSAIYWLIAAIVMTGGVALYGFSRSRHMRVRD